MRTLFLACAVAVAALLGPAREARSEAGPLGSSSAGPLARYKARLEAEAFRIFAPEVTGDVRSVLSDRSVELWAALTIYEWQGMLLRWVGPLEKAAKVVVRRSEVLHGEEQVSDAYGSTVFQQATVHAVQGGIERVLAASAGTLSPRADRAAGFAPEAEVAPAPAPAPAPRSTPFATPPADPAPRRRLAPPVARDAAPSYVTAPKSAPRVAPRPAPAAATPAPFPAVGAFPARPPTPAPAIASAPRPSARSAVPAPPPTGTTSPSGSLPSLAPAALGAYRTALDKDAYRVLMPEIERGMQDALAARRAEMRAAPTVAAWCAALVEAAPSLKAASRVLERRTEVARKDARVLDAHESPVSQRAAVEGLQSGLDRVLAQFGR